MKSWNSSVVIFHMKIISDPCHFGIFQFALFFSREKSPSEKKYSDPIFGNTFQPDDRISMRCTTINFSQKKPVKKNRVKHARKPAIILREKNARMTKSFSNPFVQGNDGSQWNPTFFLPWKKWDESFFETSSITQKR